MTDEKIERVVHGAIRLGTYDGIRLAHRVLERFPEAKKRHMFIAGGAALSSALLIGAAMGIARRVRAGQSPEEAVNDITEDEIEGVHLLQRRRRPTATELGNGANGGSSNGAHSTAGAAAANDVPTPVPAPEPSGSPEVVEGVDADGTDGEDAQTPERVAERPAGA